MSNETDNPDIPSGKDKIKYFQAAKWYLPVVGGIETVAVALTDAVKNKYDVKILACSEEKKKTVGKFGGVDVVKTATRGCLCSMPISFSYPRAFAKMSKDANVIQLHAPFPLSDLSLCLCGGRKKAKVFVWWHSDVVKQKKLLFFYRPLMEWMLKRADGILVASDKIKCQSAYLGKYADKVTVVPFGTDIAKFDRVADKGILAGRASGKESVKLLFVGRLVYYKGVSVLIEAMKHTENAELFVVGAGPLEEELKRLADGTDKVHFLGSLPEEDMLSVYKECDVFVLPSVSKAECFGLVQLEAMACGKPVINTALPTAVPEVSLDGVTGLTVPPEDPEKLAEAINKLAADPGMRKRYGEAALKRCRERYSLDVMKKKILEIYGDR